MFKDKLIALKHGAVFSLSLTPDGLLMEDYLENQSAHVRLFFLKSQLEGYTVSSTAHLQVDSLAVCKILSILVTSDSCKITLHFKSHELEISSDLGHEIATFKEKLKTTPVKKMDTITDFPARLSWMLSANLAKSILDATLFSNQIKLCVYSNQTDQMVIMFETPNKGVSAKITVKITDFELVDTEVRVPGNPLLFEAIYFLKPFQILSGINFQVFKFSIINDNILNISGAEKDACLFDLKIAPILE